MVEHLHFYPSCATVDNIAFDECRASFKDERPTKLAPPPKYPLAVL
jgi:hypothetical protein